MESKKSSILSRLLNQPTWLAVEGTSWILLKEPFLNKEGIYNLRNEATHRPAESYEMMEIREMLQNSTDETESQVWSDLSARCTYLAYNAVKELNIRDNEITSKGKVIYNLRNKLKIAEKDSKDWRRLAWITLLVLGVVAITLMFI